MEVELNNIILNKMKSFLDFTKQYLNGIQKVFSQCKCIQKIILVCKLNYLTFVILLPWICHLDAFQ